MEPLRYFRIEDLAPERDDAAGILELAGLHRCPHYTGAPMYCGCAPGKCAFVKEMIKP